VTKSNIISRHFSLLLLKGASKAQQAVGVADSVYPNATLLTNTTRESFCETYNVLAISGKISNIDPTDGTFRMRLSFFPCGDLVGDFSEKNSRGSFYPPAVPINVTFHQKELVFARKVLMPTQEVTLSFEQGDINAYPLDVYEASYQFITGTYFNPTTNNITTVPIAFEIVGGLQAWSISPEVEDYEKDGSLLSFNVQFKRSATTKVCLQLKHFKPIL
jgi:hypothetical protein